MTTTCEAIAAFHAHQSHHCNNFLLEIKSDIGDVASIRLMLATATAVRYHVRIHGIFHHHTFQEVDPTEHGAALVRGRMSNPIVAVSPNAQCVSANLPRQMVEL